MSKCKVATIADECGIDLSVGSSRSVAVLLGLGPSAKSSVGDHRRGSCACTPEIHKIHTDTHNRRDHLELGPDGGSLTYHTTDPQPIRDWTDVLVHLGADPELWDVASDTVRVSRWQQSSKEGGERDLVWLTAYKAEIRTKTSDVDLLGDLIGSVRNWTPTERPSGAGEPLTIVVGLADWQIGKSESGVGTLQTVERIMSSLDGTRDYIEARIAEGKNIERILLANMGDHIESTHGSYASQAGSVDLNLRDQLSMALELNMAWIKAMREYAPVTYTVALCNHGVFSRVGHDSVTGDADNAGGFIGDQLRTVCKYNDTLADVEFVVPRDEMITTYTTSGVNIAMAHGHKISGNEGTWLASQSTMLTHRNGFIPSLWLTAHKHHAEHKDYGPYSRIQCTTVDPGSKWFMDAKGQYSTPGTTVFTTGAHLPMKWDDYKVIV